MYVCMYEDNKKLAFPANFDFKILWRHVQAKNRVTIDGSFERKSGIDWLRDWGSSKLNIYTQSHEMGCCVYSTTTPKELFHLKLI